MKKVIAYLLTCVFASSMVAAQCTAQTVKTRTNLTPQQKEAVKKKAVKKRAVKKEVVKRKAMQKRGTTTGGAAHVKKQKKVVY